MSSEYIRLQSVSITPSSYLTLSLVSDWKYRYTGLNVSWTLCVRIPHPHGPFYPPPNLDLQQLPSRLGLWFYFYIYLRELKFKCLSYHFEKIYECSHFNGATSVSIQTTVVSYNTSCIELGQLDIPQTPFPICIPMPNKNSKIQKLQLLSLQTLKITTKDCSVWGKGLHRLRTCRIWAPSTNEQ